jgi:arylamine N-acetyltransferase
MTEQLNPSLVEQVLERFGFSQKPPADFTGLTQIYDAWCRRVPFDNVRKMIHVRAEDPGPLPGDTPNDFFENWLRHGTGATCWGGNGSLCALLKALEFDACRGVATMMVAPDLPPNHGTVIVRLDNHLYGVDASILQGQPLSLDRSHATSVDHPAWGVKASFRDNRWHIFWRALLRTEGFECRIEYFPSSPQEFHDRHEQSRPWSPFNYQVHARINRGDAVIGLALGQKVEISSDGSVEKTDLDHIGRQDFLIRDCGMSEEIVSRLPIDVPTPPPPGSETARKASVG